MPGKVSKGPGNQIRFRKSVDQGSQTNLFKGHVWHAVLKTFLLQSSDVELSSLTHLGKRWRDSPFLEFLHFYRAVWTFKNKPCQNVKVLETLTPRYLFVCTYLQCIQKMN